MADPGAANPRTYPPALPVAPVAPATADPRYRDTRAYPPLAPGAYAPSVPGSAAAGLVQPRAYPPLFNLPVVPVVHTGREFASAFSGAFA